MYRILKTNVRKSLCDSFDLESFESLEDARKSAEAEIETTFNEFHDGIYYHDETTIIDIVDDDDEVIFSKSVKCEYSRKSGKTITID